MTEHAGPLPSAAGWWRPLLPVLRLLWQLLPQGLRKYLSSRFSDVSERERWGYLVWLTMGVVIAIPEVTAAFGIVPWPTISSTVAYLEFKWWWVALIVVGLIVFGALHAVRFPVLETDKKLAEQADKRELWRTSGGRMTRKPEIRGRNVPGWYFRLALLAVAVPTLVAIFTSEENDFRAGYVLYGLIAVFWVIVPSAWAYWRARDVPWPTLFWTVAKLARRLHIITFIVATGLVALLIHLVLYPWPSVIRDLQCLHDQNAKTPSAQLKCRPPTPHSP